MVPESFDYSLDESYVFGKLNVASLIELYSTLNIANNVIMALKRCECYRYFIAHI